MAENDLQIEQGLMQQMKDHPKLDTAHIHIAVHEGHVTLKGRADTEEEKALAEQIATSYPRVVSVRNELHVELGLLHTITSIVSEIAASNEEELHHKPPPDDKKSETPKKEDDKSDG